MDSYTHDGLTFEVSDHGPAGARVVIALHGFPEDRHCWDELARSLVTAGYRVLAPDQRGYSPGARPGRRRDYAMVNLAGDVLALAEAAAADRFDVIGHDWGGMVAWSLAARHPERVRTATVLVSPHPQAFRHALGHSAQGLRSWYMGLFQLPWLPERLFALKGGKAGELLLRRTGLDAATATRYARRFASGRDMTGPLDWYRAIPFHGPSYSSEVTVPTLYVTGDRDRFVTRAAGEATVRFVSGPYRFVVLPGRSHWLPTEAGPELSDLVLAHLAEHPR
jgi:pimeloyl-ACP methyl ester carboxylesterase